MDPPPITVVALENQPRGWLPNGQEPPTVLEPDLEQRRHAFARRVEHRLQFQADEDHDRVSAAQGRLDLQAALVVATDAALAGFFLGPLGDGDIGLDEQQLEKWLDVKLGYLLAAVSAFLPWETQSQGEVSRPAADRTAQRTVRRWYGNRCVLTGTNRPEGAHIVPVRVTAPNEARLYHVWSTLSMFYPVNRMANLAYRGREATNILPLASGAHGRYDSFEFYLRPITDPVSPATRLYLQFVWTEEENDDHELTVGTLNGDAVLPEVINGRRAAADAAAGIRGDTTYRPVRTGDVFALTTCDPTLFPLPSLEYLQIQAGVHRILGGLRAAATLASLFRGLPPDDDDDGTVAAAADALEDDDDLPHVWKVLLLAAVEKRVLELRDASRWARAFARNARNAREEQRRFLEPDSDDGSRSGEA